MKHEESLPYSDEDLQALLINTSAIKATISDVEKFASIKPRSRFAAEFVAARSFDFESSRIFDTAALAYSRNVLQKAKQTKILQEHSDKAREQIALTIANDLLTRVLPAVESDPSGAESIAFWIEFCASYKEYYKFAVESEVVNRVGVYEDILASIAIAALVNRARALHSGGNTDAAWQKLIDASFLEGAMHGAQQSRVVDKSAAKTKRASDNARKRTDRYIPLRELCEKLFFDLRPKEGWRNAQAASQAIYASIQCKLKELNNAAEAQGGKRFTFSEMAVRKICLKLIKMHPL